MKNAQASARWSPRRVGVSVMNSRNAASEASANSTITPALPKAKARPMTATIHHQALMRPLRFSIVGLGVSVA